MQEVASSALASDLKRHMARVEPIAQESRLSTKSISETEGRPGSRKPVPWADEMFITQFDDNDNDNDFETSCSGRRVFLDEEREECVVCAEEKPSAEFERPTTNCTHASSICKQCVQKHLRVAVVERGLIDKALVCPFEYCPSKFKMTDLQNLFEEGHVVLATYARLSSVRALEGDPNFRWCPRNGCGDGQLLDGIEQSSSWTCSKCKSKICTRHRSLFHDGLTCDQYDRLATWRGRWFKKASRLFRSFQWRAQGLPAEEKPAEFRDDERRGREQFAREREEAATLAALKKLRVKKCPNCGQGLQKNGGCDHFICEPPAGCQAQFSWSTANWAGA